MKDLIQFNTVTMQNFLSFGPQVTEIDLRGNYITVVLGLNHDTGGDESRNGVGKSALIDAISYCLFGESVRGISNQALINKMARKGQGMLVTLELDTPSGSYRIERGEAPSKLRLFRKELEDETGFLTRDGTTFVHEVTKSKAETLEMIQGILGFDIKLFQFLIANSSESDAFMKLPEDKKREIAERLMGLNLLTQRAEALKEDRKGKKKDLVAGESALEATRQANARIEQQVRDLQAKEAQWERDRSRQMDTIKAYLSQMESVDIPEQIEILKLIDELDTEQKRITAERRDANTQVSQAKRDLADLNREIDQGVARLNKLGGEKKKIEACVCPTCNQHWVADPSVLEKIQEEIDVLGDFSVESTEMLDTAQAAVDKALQLIDVIDEEDQELQQSIKEIAEFDLAFNSAVEAGAAGAKLEAQRDALAQLEASLNPHTDTVKGLNTHAVKQVDDTSIQELRLLIRHYDYLIDLLQSKESFLRKAVIEQWLPRLNGRIAHYLNTLELPYTVRLENDLTMSITDFGQEFVWGNLSKGQRQRVTIALNLAFQDLFEATNNPLSLLMIDELIDSGICSRGANQTLLALRESAERKNKRVFLITHRMDIADQIDDVMVVEMKNRISRIDMGNDDE
jgi:DNA repair exonuclease SbcCD ATPase subunit